jgi:hypothetical protein
MMRPDLVYSAKSEMCAKIKSTCKQHVCAHTSMFYVSQQINP